MNILSRGVATTKANLMTAVTSHCTEPPAYDVIGRSRTCAAKSSALGATFFKAIKRNKESGFLFHI